MNTPTGYRAMLGSSERVSEFHTWDADRLSEFFRKRGLGEYCHVLKKHKITGRLGKLIVHAGQLAFISQFQFN